jgi:hypothetical protein
LIRDPESSALDHIDAALFDADRPGLINFSNTAEMGGKRRPIRLQNGLMLINHPLGNAAY